MKKERRKTQRTIVVNLDLFTQEPHEFFGKVINLSEGGLLVITDKRFDENTILNVRFLFNQIINFDFSISIIWSEPSKHDKSKYHTGVEFIENPDLQAHFIQQMIKVYGQGSLEEQS
jgi:hypothetical protein